MRARTVGLVIVVVSAALTLNACGQPPTTTSWVEPARVQASPSSGVPKVVPGPGGAAGQAPPIDPSAIALARQWIDAATPPPGVRTLDTAPASGPKQPATSVGCDWLVQATKWWSTDSAHAVAVSAWLTQHPVKGLAVNGTMNGPGGQKAIFESAPQKHGSLEFEFGPDGDGITIRVDVILVPAGAECAYAGLAPTSATSSLGG